MAYFLAAPTLTYQLNFPRLRQRRWRLLSRWMLLAVMTAMVMSFMQVRKQYFKQSGLHCRVLWVISLRFSR
jgi:hypothetical protein